MWAFLNKHYQRYFYEPQSILLLLLVLSGVLVVWLLGNLLLPFLLAVIVAYVLEGFVQYVASGQSGRKLVVVLVFLLFMALSALFALVVVPVVLSQTSELLRELPYMLATALDYVKGMPQRYPDIFSEEQVGEFIGTFRSSSLQLLQNSALDISLASVSFLVVSVVYIVIVPFTVFFLLYDKGNIVAWVQGFLPRNRLLLQQVWLDMDRHLSNYLRGKFYEIMILGITSYVLFIYYDLNYASLMAVLFGLSVIIPYLGAVIVTAMAIAIAVFQWGFVDTTYIFSTLVLILQLLDGYVLVPLLFSRAVNLHPVAVILSIVFFGGIWGVWGVVLSIPLGTFIKVLIDVWPNPLYESDGNTEMGAAAGVDPTPAGSHYDGPEDSKK